MLAHQDRETGQTRSRTYVRAEDVLFLAPWLTFLPVNLAFIGYGDRLIGRPLTAPELGLVWTGLAALYLLAGFLLACAAILAARATRSRVPA